MSKTIHIEVTDDTYKILKKRAEKNLTTIEELVKDIVRRSSVSYKEGKTTKEQKVDDSLIGLFSRDSRGKR